MEITMYELYGKIYYESPPKHIRVYGEDWYWNDYDGYVTKESLKTTPDAQIYLMDRYRTYMDLDKAVEIVEEEKKIPEKLGEFDIQGLEVSGYSMTQAEYLLEDGIKENREMINWILDYLKSKGE